MNILIIGDVVGSPGRAIMKKALPIVFREHDIDYCIANVENAAGGFGVTKEVCDEILDMGVDCMTSGNHIWDKKEILGVVDLIPQLLRPLNYPRDQPGRGSYVGRAKDSKVPVATLNLSGRVFMNGAMDDPFRLALEEVERLRHSPEMIARTEQWKDNLLEHPMVGEFASSLWDRARHAAEKFSAEPKADILHPIERGIARRRRRRWRSARDRAPRRSP